MHTTSSDYEYDDVPELPSYSDIEAAALLNSDHVHNSQSATPADDYAVTPATSTTGWYGQSYGKLDTGSETTIRMDKRLQDPEELPNYITKGLALLLPKIQVRIRGWHRETFNRNNKKETSTVVDFDMDFSLVFCLPSRAEEAGWQPRLVADSERAYRGSWRKTRAEGYKRDIEIGGDEPEFFEHGGQQYPTAINHQVFMLMRWIREYCESSAKLRVFRLRREVSGLDTEYMCNAIERLIRSTNYRGHVSVSFPIADKNVDIYTPHWVNCWRTSWIRYILYFSMLWIATWSILFFMTKRWKAYHVDWRFSYYRGEQKFYSRISEQSWFEMHANLIRRLALDRFQCDATDLPLDAGNTEEQRRRGPLPTGNADVDTAVSAIQEGVGIWNTLSRGGRQGAVRWGEDS